MSTDNHIQQAVSFLMRALICWARDAPRSMHANLDLAQQSIDEARKGANIDVRV